jgi:Niemann-Pick C1 N terminus
MAALKIYSSLLLLSLMASLSLQYCVLRSNCTSEDPDCYPYILNQSDPDDIAPQKWEFPDDLKGVCPEYEDIANCCNSNTMDITKSKLVQVDIGFGNPANGCSICANNMKRFFCKYNCDPNQHLFIPPGQSKYKEVIPGPGQDPIKVVESNVIVDPIGGCAMYESCKSVDFVKALGSMASYVGYFNTLSSQGVTQGRVIMNYQFTPVEGALQANVDKCSAQYSDNVDKYNYTFFFGQGWCNCQHCSYNCSNEMMDFSMYIKQHGVLDGLNFSTIERAGLVAAVILLLGLLLRFTLFSNGRSSKSEKVKEVHEGGKPGYFAMNA